MGRIATRKIVANGNVDIRKILKVYKLIDQGKIDIIRDSDLNDALMEMFAYYDDYLKWYKKHGYDPQRQGEAAMSEGKTEADIVKDFKQRYRELLDAIRSGDHNQKLYALDRAIDQVHVDMPVLMHITELGAPDDGSEAGEQKFFEIADELIDTLDSVRGNTSVKVALAALPTVAYTSLDIGEAELAAKNGHLVSISDEFLLDDEQVLRYLKDKLGFKDKELVVPWKVREGVNLFSYRDEVQPTDGVIAEIEITDDYKQFGPYVVAKDPHKCKVRSFLYKGINLTPEAYLETYKGRQGVKLGERIMNWLNNHDDGMSKHGPISPPIPIDEQEESTYSNPELTKFMTELGFQENIIIGVETEETEDTIVNQVKINTARFEEVPFLKGGKILSVLQAFAKRLPIEYEGKKVEWLFIPSEDITEEVEEDSIQEIIIDLGSTKKAKVSLTKQRLLDILNAIRNKVIGNGKQDISNLMKQIKRIDVIASTETEQLLGKAGQKGEGIGRNIEFSYDSESDRYSIVSIDPDTGYVSIRYRDTYDTARNVFIADVKKFNSKITMEPSETHEKELPEEEEAPFYTHLTMETPFQVGLEDSISEIEQGIDERQKELDKIKQQYEQIAKELETKEIKIEQEPEQKEQQIDLLEQLRSKMKSREQELNQLRGLVHATKKMASVRDELIEELSDLEHEQWMKWSKELAKKEKLSEERVERWEKDWKPYDKLRDDIKEFDRIWARKVLKIVNKYMTKLLKASSIKLANPGSADAKLLNTAFGKIGQEAMKSGLLDVAVAFQIGKHIINQYLETDKNREPYWR